MGTTVGRPPLTSESPLTPLQEAFVKFYGRHGGSPTVAAAAVGYANDQVGNQLLRLPHVLTALHREVQRSLLEDAPNNFRVMREIRDDDSAPKGVRVDVAKHLGRLAGHVEPTKPTDQADKPLSEMSADELRAYVERSQREIDRLEGELASRAKDVSAPLSAPDTAPADAKPLTFLD